MCRTQAFHDEVGEGDCNDNVATMDEEEGHGPWTAVARQRTHDRLKATMGISVQVPCDRLCPTPGRLEYVQWVTELLSLPTSPTIYQQQPKYQVVDMGVSASCIYPIMGCKCAGWTRVLGSDIDPSSLAIAHMNLKANNMVSQVHLVQVCDGER